MEINAVKKNELKVQLGECISSYRKLKMISQRGLAKKIGLANSNLKYIEDGVNAPSANVYRKIIEHLQPPGDVREKMDYLYAQIRETPPPEVCDFLIENRELFDPMRLGKKKLSKKQIEKITNVIEERK